MKLQGQRKVVNSGGLSKQREKFSIPDKQLNPMDES